MGFFSELVVVCGEFVIVEIECVFGFCVVVVGMVLILLFRKF